MKKSKSISVLNLKNDVHLFRDRLQIGEKVSRIIIDWCFRCQLSHSIETAFRIFYSLDGAVVQQLSRSYTSIGLECKERFAIGERNLQKLKIYFLCMNR